MAQYQDYIPGHITCTTMDKYYRVANAYLENGFKAAEAYQSVYPKANKKTGCDNFCKIKSIPEIREYIARRRLEAFENKNVDVLRIKDELSGLAFCSEDSEYVNAASKIKALELLLKTLKDDEAALKAGQTKEEVIEIEVDDED